MTSDIENILKRFALQRKPFVTLADALNLLYREFHLRNKAAAGNTAPFDFTILERKENDQVFRFILSYSAEKVESILANKTSLAQLANQVLQGTEKERVDSYYHRIVQNPENVDPVEFITAVFHLSFSYRVPIQFNPGRIYERHLKHNHPYYRARMLDKRDVARFKKIEIEGQVYEQVNDSFKSAFEKGRHFYKDWVAIVQNLASESRSSGEFDYHLYLPIYDGLSHMQGALRGFLGIYFREPKSREDSIPYFMAFIDVIQNLLNNVFVEGVKNYIVDGYIEALDDPVIYWKEHLHYLHNWQHIRFNEDSTAENAKEELWNVTENVLQISLIELLRSNTHMDFDPSHLLNKYADKRLDLAFPSLTDIDLSSHSSYVQGRVIEVVGLLDQILEKRQLLISLENSQRASRKSAVAAVMSRNMSHNIGSHVLARLSSQQTAHQLDPVNMAKLNSYLRTRMDFLADISTAGSSVTMPRRLYQDICNEFKSNQHLLLDYISGTALVREQIKIVMTNNGKKVTLSSLDRDPVVALPNDVLGAQAFYIILENIIRNCAKHADIENILKLTIRVDEPFRDGDTLYRIRIIDNLKTCRDNPGLVETLNRTIEKSIIDRDGFLRQGYWGLLEMKIAAAYLRKVFPEDVDLNRYGFADSPTDREWPLLRALSIEDNLAYEFFLLKPHKVSVILCTPEDLPESRISELKNWGIDISADSDLFNSGPSKQEDHEFLIVKDPSERMMEYHHRHRKILPFRIFEYGKNSTRVWPRLEGFTDVLATADMYRLSAFVWERRVADLWGDVPCVVNSYGDNRSAVYRVASSSEEKKVLFDLHGDYFRRTCGSDPKKLSDVLYYQPYGSASPIGLILNRLATLEQNLQKWIVCELLESARLRIAIVDERIQHEALQRVDRHCETVTLFRVLSWMNVFIPERELDLYKQQFTDQDRSRIESWIEDRIRSEKIDFIIIHLGIIEKLVGTERSSIERWIRDLEKSQNSQNRTELIVISGRGMPANLPPDVFFLPYSPVARYILDQLSKYHLTKVLYSARRH